MVTKIIHTVNRYLFYLAAIPICAAAILTICDIAGRAFRHPIPGTLETSALFLAVTVALTLPHAQAMKDNTIVDVFFNFLPAKLKAVLDFMMTVLSLIIVGFIIRGSWNFVAFSKRTMEWTDPNQWPLWPFKAVLILGMTLLALQLLLDAREYIKDIGKVFRGGHTGGPPVEAGETLFKQE